MNVPGQVTNPERLETRDLTYASDGASIKAYLARPRAPGSYPGVIVIHEAWGVVEHIRDVARRFANLGYIALAPDLYTRVGAPGTSDGLDIVRSRMLALSDAQLVRDLERASDLINAEPGATGKLGCVGFCMGGRTTLLFACSSNRLSAAIDCWGGFITSAAPGEKTTPNRPTPVIDLVPKLSCPLYVVCGAEDTNPSPADCNELSERLRHDHKQYTCDVFQNAGHAFFADYRPNYREAAALALWPKMVSFFDSHLKGTK